MTIGFEFGDISKKRCDTYFETGLFDINNPQCSIHSAVRCKTFKKIISIELNKNYCDKAREYFKNEPRVIIINDDSTNIHKYFHLIEGRCMFFLDAHYDGLCKFKEGEYRTKSPLLLELEAIKSLEPTPIILIDDIRIIKHHQKDWGLTASIYEDVINLLTEINPHYEMTFLRGYVPNDVLFCC